MKTTISHLGLNGSSIKQEVNDDLFVAHVKDEIIYHESDGDNVSATIPDLFMSDVKSEPTYFVVDAVEDSIQCKKKHEGIKQKVNANQAEDFGGESSYS